MLKYGLHVCHNRTQPGETQHRANDTARVCFCAQHVPVCSEVVQLLLLYSALKHVQRLGCRYTGVTLCLQKRDLVTLLYHDLALRDVA